jgi:phage host-nuclease inhibitor protein Gam
MARSKKAAADVPVPQTIEEADAFVAAIGDAQRRLAMIQTQASERAAEIKAAAEAEAAPFSATIETLTAGLATWAAANRKALTQDGATKTVKLAAGEIGWRIKPPSIQLSDIPGTVSVLLADPALHRFVRTKHEVDREALLREQGVAAGLHGVRVRSGVEEFFAAPAQMELAATGEARTAA